MTLSAFVKASLSALSDIYPREEARSIVLSLCRGRLAVPDYLYVTEPSFVIPEGSLGILESDMRRLLAHEPLQYVLGRCDFCGRSFNVAPGVLIPRPETEELVGHALGMMKGSAVAPSACPRVLDLCTGSGCIAWSLLLSLPGCSVTAVDISDEALQIARGQFGGKTPSPRFVRADILDFQKIDAALGDEKYDLLVSNPPYIKECEKPLMRPNVLQYEPSLALFVKDDDPLVFYRAIAALASSRGIPRGIVEINETLGSQTSAVFRDAGFGNVEILKDLPGRERFVRFA